MIQLPEPHIADCSLYDAMKNRRTHREMCHDVSLQKLSNILWCANGINEVKERQILRTAPSAHNQQEIDLYVFYKEGVYLYDPSKNGLELVASGDFRGQIGKKDFVRDAPYVICIAADYNKMQRYHGFKLWMRYHFSRIDAGYVSQNIYLACSAERLHTVACGLFHENVVKQILKKSKIQPLLIHPIG